MFKKLAFGLQAAAMATSLGGCCLAGCPPEYHEYVSSRLSPAALAMFYGPPPSAPRLDAATQRRLAAAAAADPRTHLCHSSGPGGSTTYRCTEAERAVQDEAARQVRRSGPPPSAPTKWAGPSVGTSGGFGRGRSKQTDPGIIPVVGDIIGGPADGSFSLNGGLIGGGGGYNWQYYRWVFGLETDYSWANISGSSSGCGAAFISHTCSTQVDSLGTSQGGFGYAYGMDESWRLYGTGGLTYGEGKGSDS